MRCAAAWATRGIGEHELASNAGPTLAAVLGCSGDTGNHLPCSNDYIPIVTSTATTRANRFHVVLGKDRASRASLVTVSKCVFPLTSSTMQQDEEDFGGVKETVRAWLQDLSSSSSSISEPVRRFGMSAGCRVPLSAGEGDQLRSASTRQSLSVALSRQKSIVLAQAVPTPSSSSRRQPPADPAQQTEQTPQQSKLCSRRICLLDDAMPRSLFLAPPRRRIACEEKGHTICIHLHHRVPPPRPSNRQSGPAFCTAVFFLKLVPAFRFFIVISEPGKAPTSRLKSLETGL